MIQSEKREVFLLLDKIIRSLPIIIRRVILPSQDRSKSSAVYQSAGTEISHVLHGLRRTVRHEQGQTKR